MALETERAPAKGGPVEAVLPGLKWLARLAGRVGLSLLAAAQWLGRLPPARLISASLLRRILATNLIGLLFVIGGILYLGQYHAWLIDAKRDSLKVQGEILSAAIASDARVEGGNIQLQADRLGTSPNAKAPYRDDGFAALELSIRPERVTPLLRKLVQPGKARARIYGQDGTLIVDSARLLTRGQLTRTEPSGTGGQRIKTKNFWTRLKQWRIDKDLPVYKEIGNANGMSYPEVKVALTGTSTAMLLLDDDGEQIVSVAVPIRRMNAILGVLMLSTPPGEIDDVLDEEQRLVLTLAAVALLASIGTSILLARTVAGPMRRLSDVAEQVSRNLASPEDLPRFEDRSDEVGQMARAFRTMTAALYRRVEGSERFAADVAHELKNPLTAARSTAESLAYAKSDEQRAHLVQQIQNELKRLNRLITDVSNASRLDAELARQQMKPLDATAVVGSVVQIFKDILSEDGRKVVAVIEPAPFEGAYVVRGDEGRLAQVLTNLTDNAVSFSPPGGVVTIRARHAAQNVVLAVEDQGPGIPEGRLDVVFDRFYSDRPATEAKRGKNSGLGLSISREIIKAHGGEIRAENIRSAGAKEDGKPRGARFVLELPALNTSPRTGLTGGRRA
jgi:two-component system sensor histidine kinase ChvG